MIYLSTVSVINPVEHTYSVVSLCWYNHPLKFCFSSSESPSSCEMDKTMERTEDSDPESKGARHSPRTLTNGGEEVVRPHSANERDSVGNYSLPPSSRLISQNSSPTLIPKSQSELNIKKLMKTSVSVPNDGKLDSERLENKKKRNQFLKLFKKKKS